MRFVQILSTLAFAAVGLADTWAGFENLPDGFYAGEVHANGSTTVHAVSSSNRGETGQKFYFDLVSGGVSADRVETETKRSSRVQKRKTSECLNGNLDHYGTDQALRQLRVLVGPNYGLNSQGVRYIGYNVNGVYVYICNRAAASTWEFFSNDDIDFSNYWLDQDCGYYKSGYFWWPGNGNRIYGKAWTGTAVCLPA
jgi:hypothetical protein